MFYLVDSGMRWRAMPCDFPVWQAVYRFFRRYLAQGLLSELHDRLRRRVCVQEGRDPERSAGIIDSQSVKADAVVGAGSRGFDGFGAGYGSEARRVDCRAWGAEGEEFSAENSSSTPGPEPRGGEFSAENSSKTPVPEPRAEDTHEQDHDDEAPVWLMPEGAIRHFSDLFIERAQASGKPPEGVMWETFTQLMKDSAPAA
ncbi:transposase [Streptomyces kronopolitis]